ncbi:hypothetical protein [Brevibacillus panacihumi]|uniref:Uncharacterized protein n=1 Tax=Brevibacillus panacihumi TaxID=497735 RepID=A0A3M8BV22_9BACL|nr:hypothetical protein [Brevibacillus panacihumi]RNB67271.1 hypothetical protein EDM58_25375 [Brevibacillus panacihumi]
MWKKGSALLIAGMLVLSGCSGEASLVRDSIVQTLDKPNYDYQGTLKLTGDIDKLPEALGEPVDPEGKAVLEALKAGVTVKGSQLDLENAKAVIEVNDDKLLRDNKLWSGDKKASVELLVSKDSFYLKSPLDSKYLVMSADVSGDLAAMGASEAANPAKLKEYQEKMNDLTISFIKKYVAKYGYKLNNVKNLGATTVELPNGEKAEATHIAIKLDAKELVNMFFYTANDAVASQDVKAFAIDMMVLSTSLQEEMFPEDGKTTEAEKRATAEAAVTSGLAEAKKWLEESGKVYTADKVVEEMKAAGFHALNWNLDFYINKDKLPVQQKSALSVTFQVDGMKQPLTVGLEADQYAYNFGKATKYEIPGKDAGVTVEQLYNDEKAIDSFSDKGFFRLFVQSSLDQYKAQKEWEEEWANWELEEGVEGEAAE